MTRVFSLLLAALIYAPWFPASSPALELEPFATSNQAPLVRIYGLPTAARATLLGKGRASVRLTVEVANSLTRSRRSGEAILLDGETTRGALTLRYGLGPRVEVGIEVPYLSHSGGVLDRFIENWHDAFGLPQGGRDRVPRNRLAFIYIRDSEVAVDLEKDASGFGDLRLLTALQLWGETSGSSSAALHLSLKLPTGDSERLLGSGSTDLALSLAGARNWPLELGRLSVFGSAGLLLMGDSEVLEEQQRPAVGFGSLGAGWAPRERFGLKLQLNGHSSFYRDSNLNEIDSGSVQLTVGASLGLTPATVLDLAVTEDILVDTAPDVVVHFSLKHTF